MEQIDVLIVVSTEAELNALLIEAQKMSKLYADFSIIHKPDRTYYDLGRIGGARTLVIQTEMGTATVGGTLSTITLAISEVNPATILMVGIAFGLNPEKHPIGTILVSKQIQQYEIQRIGTGAQGELVVIPRGDRATATTRVLSRLRATKSAFAEPVEFGLLLSGEKLLDNINYRDNINKLEPEALGGEMEGGGLYVAATEKKIDWCVVKAICDYADGLKREYKKERQQLAAHNAAKFAISALVQGGFVMLDISVVQLTLRAGHLLGSYLGFENFPPGTVLLGHLSEGARPNPDALPGLALDVVNVSKSPLTISTPMMEMAPSAEYDQISFGSPVPGQFEVVVGPGAKKTFSVNGIPWVFSKFLIPGLLRRVCVTDIQNRSWTVSDAQIAAVNDYFAQYFRDKSQSWLTATYERFSQS